MPAEAKVEKVMREFKRGTLRSSSGDKVTSRAQALAIAMAEQRRNKSNKRRKKKKKSSRAFRSALNNLSSKKKSSYSR